MSRNKQRNAYLKSDAGAGKQKRILVVDDDPQVLEVQKRMLEMLGYLVETRTSGRAALADFRSVPDGFDLVVADLSMPEMTGIELSRALIEVSPGLPIVLQTGFGDEVADEVTRVNGIRKCLMKPFMMKEMEETLREAFRDGVQVG